MPLYEYKCSSCAHRFERIMKFSDAPPKTCPKCHKQTIEQIISAPAIQFKGSGWYVSDYGGKNGAGTADHSHDGNGAAKSSDSSVSATAEKPATPASAASTSSAGTTASN